MPIGTTETDPLDRRVIAVATREALINNLAAPSTVQVMDGVQIGFFSVVYKAVQPLVARLVIRRQLKNVPDGKIVEFLGQNLKLGTPLTLYSPSEAMRRFSFGVGHTPRNGSIYVQHPVLPNTYIAPEEFSRTLAKEKEAAFRQLASALGAKELRLISARVHEKKGLFGTQVSVPDAASQVGLKVSFDEHGSFVKKIYSRFGKPRSKPHVPDDLKAWVEMDSDLRTMARDRVEGHLLENHITLEFKEGMGVGGEVALAVVGRGLTAASRFERLHHSVWHFEAEYWPIESEEGELLGSA